MRTLLFKAYNLAKKYFDGIKDRGGHDYIGHLERVADAIDKEMRSNVVDKKSESYQFYMEAQVVALLHDILEDTKCTIGELEEIGCTNHIIDAIKVLTHDKSEDYIDYIVRISQNPMAKLVKIYDLEDNMDLRRLTHCQKHDLARVKKYFYCRKFLQGNVPDVDTLKFYIERD